MLVLVTQFGVNKFLYKKYTHAECTLWALCNQPKVLCAFVTRAWVQISLQVLTWLKWKYSVYFNLRLSSVLFHCLLKNSWIWIPHLYPILIQGISTIFIDQMPNYLVFKKSTFSAGIKIFNSLPCSLKILKIEKTKFKAILKRYLNTHFFTL
jgi:hypothetical protein